MGANTAKCDKREYRRLGDNAMSCKLNAGYPCCLVCPERKYCQSVDGEIDCPLGPEAFDQLKDASKCPYYSTEAPENEC